MAQSVDDIIQQVIKLPIFNSVALEVIRLCSDVETPIASLVKLISCDQSLASQVLKIANSGYFNYPKTIHSLDRAILILGFNLLRDISVSLAFYSIYKSFSANTYSKLRNFWEHSLTTALILKVLGKEYDKENTDMLYIGGLVHDIGKMVLAEINLKDYLIILEKSKQENRRLIDVENKYLDYNHTIIGSRLLEYWQLPHNIVAMARYHHDLAEYPYEDNLSPYIRLAYLGNLLTHLLNTGERGLPGLKKLDPNFEKFFSFTDVEITQLVKSIEKELSEEAEYISLFE